MDINHLTYKVIGCAYKVHNVLGPGFLEKVYENALKLELAKADIFAKQQVKLPVWYEGHQVGVYYPDLWIGSQLIIEIKAVLTLASEHETKLIHYLTATGIDNGLLINFGTSVQIKRKYRELPWCRNGREVRIIYSEGFGWTSRELLDNSCRKSTKGANILCSQGLRQEPPTLFH